ncbi:MAG: thioredoxin family protein [Solirubrobacterales bacterium]
MKGKKIAVAGILAMFAAAGLTTTAGCSSGDSDGTSSAVEPAEQSSTGGSEARGSYGSKRSPGGHNAATSNQNAGAASPGQYVDYSPELLASTPGNKLLFFHASWCSQCVALEDDIEANGVPDGVTIFKVDYDSNQDLRQEYGVTIQTTMVKVDDDGEKIDSYVAYEDPTFNSVSAALLK